MNHDGPIMASPTPRGSTGAAGQMRFAAIAWTAALALSGCYDADPRSIEGALDAAARSLEARDARALFHVVDQRARHALASIVKDRRKATRLVAESYPAEDRPAALAALGDAALASDAADLFARRCTDACLDGLARRIGAPVGEKERGEEMVVETARGETLRLYRGSDGWWGVVWRTEALVAERDRAAQELRQIRENADVYRRRRALETR